MSFINTAYAAPAAATSATAQHAAPSMTPMLVILAVIILFYVWLWRNQSRKTKNQRALLDNLTKGDEVITTGGIAGRIQSVDNGYITLQVAKETNILVQKPAVASVLPKGTVKNLDK